MPPEHAGSAPPSPPPPRPAEPLHRQPTGSGQQRLGETDAQRALRIAVNVRDELGKPPNGAIKGSIGSGIWAVIVEIQRTLELTQQTLTQVRDELAAERKAREQRGGWAARVGWRVIDTLIPAAVTMGLLWVSGHIR